jgi:hypothetical protein
MKISLILMAALALLFLSSSSLMAQEAADLSKLDLRIHQDTQPEDSNKEETEASTSQKSNEEGAERMRKRGIISTCVSGVSFLSFGWFYGLGDLKYHEYQRAKSESRRHDLANQAVTFEILALGSCGAGIVSGVCAITFFIWGDVLSQKSSQTISIMPYAFSHETGFIISVHF